MSYIGNEPIVSATRTVTEITATAGQTVFTANGGYTVGYLDVFVNGAQQQASDFTATNGSTVTLNVPTQAGDDIRLVAWGTFNSANLNGAALVNSSVTPDKLSTQSQYTGFKNRIINGDMRIDQRNAGASVTITNNTNQYTVDRWQVIEDGSAALSAQRVTDAPSGFTNSFRVTVTTAGSSTSTQLAIIEQRIEGFNTADFAFDTASASAVTLSFWVKSSVTGSFSGSIRNGDSNRSYPFSYTISSANTWEQKSVTISGDTSGTWLSDNQTGMRVAFDIGSGTSRRGTANSWASSNFDGVTGAASIIGTLNATFQITGVQLEKGSTATSFDYRPYGTELALCQRYFHLIRSRFAGFSLESASGFADRMRVYGHFPVAMRATPTATITNPIYADLPGVLNRTQSSANFTSLAVSGNLIDWSAEPLNFSGLTYGATYQCEVTSSGSIQFNAEL